MAAILLASAVPAGAQLGRVRLTGEVDNNVSVDTLTVGKQRFRTFSWGDRYNPNLDGFVLDPRLMVFSLGGSLVEQNTEFSEGESRSLTLEPYRLNLSLFPQATHSFGLRASRSTTDFNFDRSEISTTTNTLGGSWNYRSEGPLPETTLDFNRQSVESDLFDGLSEVTRSTLSLRLRKSLERFQPSFNYTAELIERGGTLATTGGEEEGVHHRVQYDDRIKVGQQAILTPFVELEAAPSSRSGSGTLTLTGPIDPTLDGSTGVRYAFFEQGEITTHSATGQGQLTKRFTPDLVLTTAANGALATGGGSEAWSGGGAVGVTAAPFTHLRTQDDYALQVSGGIGPTTVMHRGHLNAVSTILPRHTLSGDYFLAFTEVSGRQSPFVGHTGTLQAVSLLVPLTTLTGTYALELQEGAGDRERQSWRLAAEVTPLPWVTGKGSGEYFTEESSGGGRASVSETGILTEAGVAVRALDWLEASLNGRYGVKDVKREDREGQVLLQGLNAGVSLNVWTLLFRAEGFIERDEDIQQNRQGVRGSFSYRFRVWTLTGDFEVSDLTSRGTDIGRQRLGFHLSRPLDFTLY